MSIWCKWFGIGCPKPPQPTPEPPKPTQKAVAVIVFDQNSHPVEGAKVRLDGDPNEFPLTNKDGYTLDPICPASLTATHLFVTKEGYFDKDAHLDLVDGEQNILTPSSVRA